MGTLPAIMPRTAATPWGGETLMIVARRQGSERLARSPVAANRATARATAPMAGVVGQAPSDGNLFRRSDLTEDISYHSRLTTVILPVAASGAARHQGLDPQQRCRRGDGAPDRALDDRQRIDDPRGRQIDDRHGPEVDAAPGRSGGLQAGEPGR